MKVAISSDSFAAELAAGDLTQLEWLERCAAALGADGVVFAREHFAREDREYLAQLKKVAVDLGLVPLGVSEPRLFDAAVSAEERLAAVEIAAGIGALFVLAVLPAPGDIPPATFVAAVGAAKAAVRAAKAQNITLLACSAPGTLGEDVSGLRHFRKDVDSAWLCYAAAAGADRSGAGSRERELLVTLEESTELDVAREVDEAARPWLLLRGAVDRARVDGVRSAAARKTLAVAEFR
jgi:hypothetical protein